MIHLYLQYNGASIAFVDKITVPTVFSCLFFPVAMSRIFAKKHDNLFGLFMLFLSLQFLLIAIVYAFETWSQGLKLMPYFCWVPASVPYLSANNLFSQSNLLLIAWLNTGGYLAIALATSRSAWRQISQTEASISQPSEV